MPKSRKSEPDNSGISRRDFFKSGTVGAVSSALVSREAAQGEAAGVKLFGPGPVPIKLNVNGRIRRLQVEPRVTLLDALRNELDVTGAKRVCDRGTCGACTVLLDGKAVYACGILAIEAQGTKIVTVEGLGKPENLHPIQQAFIDNDGLQCGFCTPGFVVAAKAFLDKNPNPTGDDLRKGLGGNLCRCGTYEGIKKALTQVAAKGGANA